MIAARDVSQWNGTINWAEVPEEIVVIKIGGGDAGLYFDAEASKNYIGAKEHGKALGGYWFAGGTDPVTEANYFIKGMSPLAENDVLVLDWEVGHANPVSWCEQFMNHIHAQTGVWPLLYINASTCNAYNWEPVLRNCGLWVADYAVLPVKGQVPIKHKYVMHQYTDKPYDKDAWFGTLEEFKLYGYKHKEAAPTTPKQVSPPVPVVAPAPTPPQTPPTPTVEAPVPSAPPVPPVVVATPETTPKVPPIVTMVSGKKTYALGLAMLAISIEKYFTGDHTLSQYLTTVQGALGANGLLAIVLRQAIAKLEGKP